MSIEDTLDELGIEYVRAGQHHHAREGWLQIKLCPWCDSSNYHLGFNLSGGFLACWKCGGHSLWSYLQKLGLDPGRIKEITRSQTDQIPEKVKAGPARHKLFEPSKRGPLLKAHRQYLRGRGFNPDVISKLWQVEGIGIHPELSWRIYIPILFRSERVSWTTRSIGDKNPQRYISASEEQEKISHKTLIYARDFCYHSIIVVEGPIDVWAIGPGAGALFGTAFTPAQVRALVDIPKRYVCFDVDAQVRAMVLSEQLSCFPGTTENIVLDAKDPGSASKKELNLLRRLVKS